MRRHVVRALVAMVVGTLPALLGALAGLLFTDPGRLLLGRLVAGELSGLMRGQFQVARVYGNYLSTIELDHVVIRDTSGGLLADVPHLKVEYKLPNLLAGRIILEDVLVDRGTIRIVKRKNGRLNFQEIFKLGESKGSGGASPLVELRDARLRATTLEALLPWNPPDTVTSESGRKAALAADRAKPGRVVLDTPDGLRKVVTLDALNARLSRLLISSPTHEPLTFEVDSLSTRISDPAITVVQLSANGWTRGDSLEFTVRNAVLPNTRASGAGTLTWPKGPVLYDFAMVSPQADLKDFHWITPNLPDMTGRARVVAKSRDEDLTSYSLRGLDLHGEGGRITGQVTMLVNDRRGLGVDNMLVDLTELDMNVVRPFLDTLPLRGRLTGKLSGRGYLDALSIDYEGVFADSAVPGGAENRLSLVGLVHLGGPNGAVFDTLTVRESDLDLATVRRLAPAVPLRGRLLVDGTLAGPWKDVTFNGTATQRDDGHPPTTIEGVARLDTRGTPVRFATDVHLVPLDLDGLRSSIPGLPLRGRLEGPLKLSGTPDSMLIDADLTGALGRIRAKGGIHPSPTHMKADSLWVEFSGLDLSEVRPAFPVTDLNGRALLDAVLDSLSGPAGDITVFLGQSLVHDVPIDSGSAVLHAKDSLITADSLLVAVPGGQVTGEGTLGWAAPVDGEMRLSFEVDSMAFLDSLLIDSLTVGDSFPHVLEGRLAGTMTVAGAIDAPSVRIDAEGQRLRWRTVRVPVASATVDWNGGDRPQLGVVVTADTVQADRWKLSTISAEVRGYADSLLWAGSADMPGDLNVASSGQWWKSGGRPVLEVDSARIELPRHVWRLRDPVTVQLAKERLAITPLFLEASDGSGSLSLEGAVPGASEAEMRIDAQGFDLRDVYLLLQRDTSAIGGTVQLDLVLGGTAASPTFRGTASLADLAVGDLASPYVQGIVDYADRRLEANLLLWKTGEPIMRVEALLPLNLALQPVAQRQLPGDLLVRAVADSTDMSVLEAFTRTVQRVRGLLHVDAQVTGSWDQPQLAGSIEIERAGASVTGLGSRFTGVSGKLALAGDSIIIRELHASGGQGELFVSGGVRLERLTRPLLNLRFRARQFRAIADRRFLDLDASGTLELTGPVWQPRLTGRLTADEGALRFADLLTKRIVDLENPEDSTLIDLTAVREEKLGAKFQNRFLDSLRIDDLRLVMGTNFWLRSSEANIQLDGDLVVNKVQNRYRLDGTLKALRGTYTLKIGFVTRDFTVESGTVRYFGTPDLNAELDITAEHIVEDVDTREEIPVIARITGTLLRPNIALESDQHPPLSETELATYLMFGRSSFAVNSSSSQSQGQSAAVSTGLSYLSSALSSEIQRTLISDLGVPIDYLDIRPGTLSTGTNATTGGAAQLAQIAAGWQVSRKWYLGLLTDVCTSGTTFYPSAEYRLNRPLRFKMAVEPTTTCTLSSFDPSASQKRYQFGLDVLWDLDY